MENLAEKALFLRNDFIELLSKLDPATPRKWGKMNVQQMIEHMSDYVRIASGKTPTSIVTAEEHLPRMQAFLESEKKMRENTPNHLLPDEPAAVRHTTVAAAINELQQEIIYFFLIFESDKAKTLNNPFFGVLNFQQQVQLLYKHSTHHLRQFGVEVE
jgi:hypothetical protein